MKKIDIYEYFAFCKEEGYSGEEALEMYERDRAEYEAELIEELEWESSYTSYQQDLIDLRRFER